MCTVHQSCSAEHASLHHIHVHFPPAPDPLKNHRSRRAARACLQPCIPLGSQHTLRCSPCCARVSVHRPSTLVSCLKHGYTRRHHRDSSAGL
jgi:hypothetical protein